MDSLLMGSSTIPGAGGVTMDALLTFRYRVGAEARLMLAPAVVLILVGARLSNILVQPLSFEIGTLYVDTMQTTRRYG